MEAKNYPELGKIKKEIENHQSIAQAIENIETVHAHLDSVIDRITGSLQKEDCPEKQPKPSDQYTLHQVLSESAEKIRITTSICHEKIDKIVELLF